MRTVRHATVALLLGLATGALHPPASASVLSADDPRFGPGSITVDQNTGYEWLDVTRSLNRSIADVSSQFGPGGDFEGFRYATRDEVTAFFQSAGLAIGFGNAPEPYETFTAMVGLTSVDDLFRKIIARVSTQQSPGQYYAPDVGVFLPVETDSGFANPSNCCATDTQTNVDAGSWLVRTGGTPPPPVALGVIAADDARYGAGAITVDPMTGYQWLDVTHSIGRSIADVSSEFGPGGDYEGFRYATKDEVTAFFQHAGLSIGFNFASDPYRAFTNMLGLTSVDDQFEKIIARVSTQAGPDQYFAPDVGTFLPVSGSSGFANPNNCCASAAQVNVDAGSWLVRTGGAVAPTPPGDDVRVQPTAPLPGGGTATASVTFGSVTATGTTVMTTANAGTPLPGQFMLGASPIYYDISTDAPFTGEVRVCLPYDPAQFADPGSAKLFHYTDGWSDVTDPVGTWPAGSICGTVTSLSPFAVGETARRVIGLGPASLWIGLKNSDDVGTSFDLMAELYVDGALVGSGQLAGVAGGGSGANNAKLRAVPMTVTSPVAVQSGSALAVKLSVRNSCTAKTHNSGTARLWFSDAQLNTRIALALNGTARTYYVATSAALAGSQVASPRSSVDVSVNSSERCPQRSFKPFGTWTTTVR